MISGSDISRVFNPTSDSLVASNGISRGGLASPHSLVLDIEKEELVKSPAMIKIREAKASVALKNHREAEKRRRERINRHLVTLREFVPCTAKMDKATLLAKVISRVKELKKNAAEASKGFLIPMDADEVKVEPSNDGSMSYRASVCCDYRPELLSELTQTLDTLQLQLVRIELSICGDRVKKAFVYTCCKGDMIHIETCQVIASNVHQALSSVLDKASSSMDQYSLGTSNPSKRSRLCYIETNQIFPHATMNLVHVDANYLPF